MTDKLEVFGFVSAFADFQRLQFGDTNDSDSDFEFSSAGGGATYEVFKEGKYSSLFVSGSIGLLDNTNFSIAGNTNADADAGQPSEVNEAVSDAILGDDYSVNFLRSFTLSATSYYTVAPVVFLVQGSFTQNFERKSGDKNIDLGNVYSVTPQAIFVVSPVVTLSGGLQFMALEKSKINGESASSFRTLLSPTFGVTYKAADGVNFSFDARDVNEADFNQGVATLGVTYVF